MATLRDGNWISRNGARAAGVGLAIAITFGLTVVTTQTTQAQTFNVIHDFSGGGDGGRPESGFTMDAAGNLYGATLNGGNGPCDGGCGLVYELKHAGSGWVVVPLYSFVAGSDGAGPWGKVILGQDGSLYGTTVAGGQGNCQPYGYTGCGTVFRLQPPAHICGKFFCPWTETVLYRFNGVDEGITRAGVVLDQSGNLYGVTSFDPFGFGNIYKLTPSGGGWTESVLHSFTGSPDDGSNPQGDLTFDNLGNLYGTTQSGGTDNQGTVLKLNPSDGTENILFSFAGDGSTGTSPLGGVIFDNAGNLYGTTSNTGPGGGGVVFELMPADGNWTFNLLYGLPGSNEYTGPWGNLVMDSAGNLYGATQGNQDGNGPDYGTVFKLTRGSGGWTYTALHVFTGGSDGGRPRCALVFDANGNLYGTTGFGGTNSAGVAFEITQPF